MRDQAISSQSSRRFTLTVLSVVLDGRPRLPIGPDLAGLLVPGELVVTGLAANAELVAGGDAVETGLAARSCFATCAAWAADGVALVPALATIEFVATELVLVAGGCLTGRGRSRIPPP